MERLTVKTRERFVSINKSMIICFLKVSRAVARGVRLIIVDNTNTMAWEMKPYVTLAVNNGYKVHSLAWSMVHNGIGSYI